MTPRIIQSISLSPGSDYAGQWIPRPRWCSWILVRGEVTLTNSGDDPVSVSGRDLADLLRISLNTRMSCGPVAVEMSGGDLNLLARRAHHALPDGGVTVPAGGSVDATVAAIIPLGDMRMVGPDGIPDGAIGGDALADYRISFSGSLPGKSELTVDDWTGQIVAMESDSDFAGRLFGAPRIFRAYSVTEAVQRVFGTRLLDVIVAGPALTGGETLSLRDSRGPLVEYSSLAAVSFAAQAPDDPDYHIPESEGFCLVTRSKGSSLLNLPAAPLEIQGFSGPWAAGSRLIISTIGDVRADLADMLRASGGAARVLLASGAKEASDIRSKQAQAVARLARWEIRPPPGGGKIVGGLRG